MARLNIMYPKLNLRGVTDTPGTLVQEIKSQMPEKNGKLLKVAKSQPNNFFTNINLFKNLNRLNYEIIFCSLKQLIK